jgi:hypothetical protein
LLSVAHGWIVFSYVSWIRYNVGVASLKNMPPRLKNHERGSSIAVNGYWEAFLSSHNHDWLLLLK